MRELSFSLITFAFNEEKLLAQQIRSWHKIFQSFQLDYEIILVNDGSTDRTKEIADELAKESKALRVIHHAENRGIGDAIQTARPFVTKKFVFWNDIDSHFDLRDLEKVMPLLREPLVDIVVAVKHDSFVKRVLSLSWIKSRANYYLIKLLFLSSIRDFQFVQFFPAKFFCTEIDLQSRSSFIPAECLIKAQRLGRRIYQIQLTYHVHNYSVRASKTNTLHTILESMRDIFSFWIYWNLGGGRGQALLHQAESVEQHG